MKINYKLEPCLTADIAHTVYAKKNIARLRRSCKPEIEMMGTSNKPKPIACHERLCKQVEDESHFLFDCEKYMYADAR